MISRAGALETGERAAAEPPEVRPYLVSLSVMIVANIEVAAASPEQAMELAEEAAKDARRRWRTEPYAFRVYSRQRDPDDLTRWIWVPIER